MPTHRTVASKRPSRIVFSDGESMRVLEACRILLQEGTGRPVLLGRTNVIAERAQRLMMDGDDYEVVDPSTSAATEEFASLLYESGMRHGFTPQKPATCFASRSTTAQ